MMKKIEYRMVVQPTTATRRAARYPKRDYTHARKGLEDWARDRANGRFQNTWKQKATVYIETREVSKWSRLDMTDVSENVPTT